MPSYRLVHLEAGHCVPWPHGRLTVTAQCHEVRYGHDVFAMAALENRMYGGSLESPRLVIEGVLQNGQVKTYLLSEMLPNVS